MFRSFCTGASVFTAIIPLAGTGFVIARSLYTRLRASEVRLFATPQVIYFVPQFATNIFVGRAVRENPFIRTPALEIGTAHLTTYILIPKEPIDRRVLCVNNEV